MVEKFEQWGSRFDDRRAFPATVAGLSLGLGLGGLAVYLPAYLGAPLFIGFLGGAVALARSGKVVAELRGDGVLEVGTGEVERPLPEAPPLVDLVDIPAGEFWLGSPKDEVGRSDDEGPRHRVRLSAFRMMRTPVTVGLYKEIMGKAPGQSGKESDELPVVNVNWHDAARFCNRLSKREKLTPCYDISEKEVAWNPEANGYRLPTEAEWEYACRAGTVTPWSHGSDESELSRYAWYGEDFFEDSVHPVGKKRPNPWGLHDMHGNVWEWCWDRYGEYSGEVQDNPTGPASGTDRVLRGGSFNIEAGNLRSADRFRNVPSFRNWNIGFRCVRAPRPQH